MRIQNEITGQVDLRSGVITIDDTETQISSTGGDAITRHYRTVLDTKDRMVRDALIAQGWTPPAGLTEAMTLHSAREGSTAS